MASRGTPAGIDVAATYRDNAIDDPPGNRTPGSIGAIDEAVHRLGATRTAPIALIRHDGDTRRATAELCEAGCWNLAIIAGGIDTLVAADGRVVPGGPALESARRARSAGPVELAQATEEHSRRFQRLGTQVLPVREGHLD